MKRIIQFKNFLKKVAILSSGFAVLFLILFNFNKNTEFKKILESSFEKSPKIKLSSLTEFTWEKLCIYPPYSRDPNGNEAGEHEHRIFFFEEEKVVNIYKLHRSDFDFIPSKDQEYCFDKNGIFRLQKKGTSIENCNKNCIIIKERS